MREKVDIAKAELPGETDEPTVNEVNVGLFPVLVVALSGNVPERTLLKHARELQKVLEALPGVLAADIGGDRDELLEIRVDAARLESYQISQQDPAERGHPQQSAGRGGGARHRRRTLRRQGARPGQDRPRRPRPPGQGAW